MRALYLALPIALVLGALIFIAMGLREPPVETAAPVTAPPRYVLTGAQWVRLGAQGQPEFRAQADSIEYFADESIQLHTITLDALGGMSSPWNLQAPAGMVPPRERRVLLEGGVVAKGQYANGAPIEFTTPVLWIDLLRRELRTDSPVLLESDLRRASARGLRADFSGDSVQLLNEVQVEYVPSS